MFAACTHYMHHIAQRENSAPTGVRMEATFELLKHGSMNVAAYQRPAARIRSRARYLQKSEAENSNEAVRESPIAYLRPRKVSRTKRRFGIALRISLRDLTIM